MSEQSLQQIIPATMAGRRLDQVLPELFPDFSRSRLQQWLKDGLITLNGKTVRAREKVFGGERIEFSQQQALDSLPAANWDAQALPLNIVYEDESVLVINKPVGLVVHPGAGNLDGTLVNAVLHHAPELEALPRGGVIHRLDKDTSGLLVVAKTHQAHKSLVEQLQAHSFEREYRAVVEGVMTAGGTVDEPIGRHPQHRTRMAVVHSGKPAVTHYRVLEKFFFHTFIGVKLETGRTHQIRVHMAHLRYPLVGDQVYNARFKLPPACSPALTEMLRGFRRQALHAARLGFVHPHSGEQVAWEADIPEDMVQLLNVLRQDTQARHEPD